MEKVISCGSIIVKDNKILIAKPYGNQKWNIPKGKMEDYETSLDTAIRETQEECNIDITKNRIIYIGTFEYLKKKLLCLYLVFINYEPTLKCNSTFFATKANKEVPEMVDFKWIEFDDYKRYFSTAMASVFNDVVPIIKQRLMTRKTNDNRKSTVD